MGEYAEDDFRYDDFPEQPRNRDMRTVRDPFVGKDVQISDRLVDRLRGKYASGPHLPNGNPEFGWRQFQSPPIQHEAAKRIEALELALRQIWSETRDMDDELLEHIHSVASHAIIMDAK